MELDRAAAVRANIGRARTASLAKPPSKKAPSTEEEHLREALLLEMRRSAEAAHKLLEKETELEELQKQMSAADASPAAGMAQASGPIVLPNGWRAVQDAKGQTYYANDVTGESVWSPPVDRRAALKKHFAASVEQLGGCLPELKLAQQLRDVTGDLRALEARFEKAEEAQADLQARYDQSVEAHSQLEQAHRASEAARAELHSRFVQCEASQIELHERCMQAERAEQCAAQGARRQGEAVGELEERCAAAEAEAVRAAEAARTAEARGLELEQRLAEVEAEAFGAKTQLAAKERELRRALGPGRRDGDAQTAADGRARGRDAVVRAAQQTAPPEVAPPHTPEAEATQGGAPSPSASMSAFDPDALAEALESPLGEGHGADFASPFVVGGAHLEPRRQTPLHRTR